MDVLFTRFLQFWWPQQLTVGLRRWFRVNVIKTALIFNSWPHFNISASANWAKQLSTSEERASRADGNFFFCRGNEITSCLVTKLARADKMAARGGACCTRCWVEAQMAAGPSLTEIFTRWKTDCNFEHNHILKKKWLQLYFFINANNTVISMSTTRHYIKPFIFMSSVTAIEI